MNKAFFAVAIIALSLFNHAVAQIDTGRAEDLEMQVEPLLEKPKDQRTFDGVAETVAAAGGCDPNVCFAIDGSASIPPEDYQLQLNFVQLVAAIVGGDPRAKFASAQYGVELEVIRRLTNNAAGFLIGVSQSKFLASPDTFIEPGLVFCVRELKDVRGEPAKIVLLGDGRSRVFDRVNSAITASEFRSANRANDICAVGVGFKDEALLEEIVGRADRVLTVRDWPVVLNILDDLVAEICDIDGNIKVTPTPSSKPVSCPCQCFRPAGSSKRDERRARREAKRQCKSFKGSKCSVFSCTGGPTVLPGFQCC